MSRRVYFDVSAKMLAAIFTNGHRPPFVCRRGVKPGTYARAVAAEWRGDFLGVRIYVDEGDPLEGERPMCIRPEFATVDPFQETDDAEA